MPILGCGHLAYRYDKMLYKRAQSAQKNLDAHFFSQKVFFGLFRAQVFNSVCATQEKNLLWLQANELISFEPGIRFLKHHTCIWWTSQFWACKGALVVADLELELQRVPSMPHTFGTTRAVTQLLVLMSLVT